MILDALVLLLCSGLYKNVQWTLEQYGFEWHGSTQRQIFFNSKYYCHWLNQQMQNINYGGPVGMES